MQTPPLVTTTILLLCLSFLLLLIMAIYLAIFPNRANISTYMSHDNHHPQGGK